MFYPTCHVPPLWVMVRPMNNSALLVPDILAIKADAVAFLESLDSRGDVNVVSHEHCLSRLKTNDESLMSPPVQIIRQQPSHLALVFDLDIAFLILERTTDRTIVNCPCRTAFSSLRRTAFSTSFRTTCGSLFRTAFFTDRCRANFNSRARTRAGTGDEGEECTDHNDENRLRR